MATAISGMDNELGGGGVVRDVAARAMQWSADLLQAQSPSTCEPTCSPPYRD
ncbi:hypothetical protein ACFU5N_25620 [Streptomyces albidoflavus]